MSLTPEEQIDLFRKLLLARRYEETLEQKKKEGYISSWLHLGTGQEAIGVGLSAALRPSDYLQISHRGYAHAVAKGAPLKNMLAEIFGRETGCSKGRCGPRAGYWPAGVLGESGILGGHVVYSTGVALAQKMQKTGNVVICCFGDGASNVGAVHEGINLASVWDLPIIYVIENNLYAISTPIKKTAKVTNLADRAKAYGIPGIVVDGNNVEAVYHAATEAVEYARSGKGPQLLEMKTYLQWQGTIENKNLDNLRTPEEMDYWRRRDPLLYGETLLERGILSKNQMDQIRAEIENELIDAINFAEESPNPDPKTIRSYLTSPIPPLPAGVMRSPNQGNRSISVREALNESLRQALERDGSVFILGEDIGKNGGDFGVTNGLFDRFGPERIRDTPISESAILGAALGAGTMGMRPIAEIMYGDFVGVCYDQILNHIAKYRFMFGGQIKVPVVIRTAMGGGLFLGAQHSQSLEALFTHIPGLTVIMPSTPYDAKGLLTQAIYADNPIIFLEQKTLYDMVGPVPEQEYAISFGQARIHYYGEDVTVVATGRMVQKALDVASTLREEGISVEVIDPRTLAPFDYETVLKSIRKTHRLVIVQEAWKTGGFASEIAATINERAYGDLSAPILRVAGMDIPNPTATQLAPLCYPGQADIIQAVKSVLR